MRTVLEFLNNAPARDIISEKTTQTYIIMGVEKLTPFRTHIVNPRLENGKLKYETVEKAWPPYIQQELDSALARALAFNRVHVNVTLIIYVMILRTRF